MFIGSRLKNLRLEKGLTQKDLGDMLNVTKVSVCCYEKGVRTPCLETLDDLINIFNVSADYFLGKDIPVIKEDTDEYTVYISKNELEFLKQLRLSKDLYNKSMEDPKRTIELIQKKLK